MELEGGPLGRRSLLSELGEETSLGVRLRGGLRTLHMSAPLPLPGDSASGEKSLLSESGNFGTGFDFRLHLAPPLLLSGSELSGDGSSLLVVAGEGIS